MTELQEKFFYEALKEFEDITERPIDPAMLMPLLKEIFFRRLRQITMIN